MICATFYCSIVCHTPAIADINKMNNKMLLLQSMPLKVLIPKIFRKITKIIKGSLEEGRQVIFGGDISDIRYCHLIGIKIDQQTDWINSFRKNLVQRTLFFDVTSQYHDISEEGASSILKSSADIMQHKFNLLGSGNVIVDYQCAAGGVEGIRYEMAPGKRAEIDQLGRIAHYLPSIDDSYSPIDWSLDFKSGFRWSQKAWFARIRFGKPGADIKVPWELSRFQHGVLLGQAYRISSNEKYANEIICQIVDWIVANPVGYGPNWACPMDIAIRVSNWIASLQLIYSSSVLTDEVLWLISKSFYQHGKHIRTHLEWSPQLTSNHYASDIAGLFFIANTCPGLPGAEEWASFSKKELEQEILKQVYEDGCDFEASTCYHRLALELFFYPALLARIIEKEFSDNYLFRLEKMFDALRLLLHGNGDMPQIGDNDSGRFFILEQPGGAVLRMDYLLPVGDWFFGHDGRGYPVDVDDSALYWLAGNRITKNHPDDWGLRPSHCFSDAGWVVMRKDGIQVVVSCGPNGQNGNGGHAHNDKLSMEVSVGGLPVIVDPGTYLYTPDLDRRNYFRSTSCHSTPQLKDLEQNPILGGLVGAFTLGELAKTSVQKFDNEMLEASHSGFGDTVKMILRIQDQGLLVSYVVEIGEYTMRWFLHSEVSPNLVESGVQLKTGGVSLLLSSECNEFDIVGYDYSPAYGVILTGWMIKHTFIDRMDWQIEVLSS